MNSASTDPQTEGRVPQPAMSTIPEDNNENEDAEISIVAEAAAPVSNEANDGDENDFESTGSKKNDDKRFK